MIFSRQGSTVMITQERATIIELVKRLQDDYSKIANSNVIVNLSSLDKIRLEEVLEFLHISNTHRGAKQSFVIVSAKIDLDELPDELIIVPTLQEAHDIVEMEEMERDLGL